jgi:hypothetical protein
MKKQFRIDFGKFNESKILESEYSLTFEVQSHPIAQLWFDMLKKLLEDSTWKLETRWAAFKLPTRHPKILVEKLKRCVETINNSDWFDYHIIETDMITEDYPMEVHNIIHHHFEILIGQVWRPSEYWQRIIEKQDWALIDAVRGLNDLSHEIEEWNMGGDATICTTFMNGIAPIQKVELPKEADEYFTLDGAFGRGYLHYAQLGKTWQEVCIDDDDQIDPGNISEHRLLSGEFDLQFSMYDRTHEGMIDSFGMREKLAKFDRTPEDKSLRLGYCPIFDIQNQGTFTPNQKEQIIQSIRNHPQIIRMNLDGVERPFTPYFDPY